MKVNSKQKLQHNSYPLSTRITSFGYDASLFASDAPTVVKKQTPTLVHKQQKKYEAVENNMKWKWVVLGRIDISKPDEIDEDSVSTDRFVDPTNHEGQKIRMKRKGLLWKRGIKFRSQGLDSIVIILG